MGMQIKVDAKLFRAVRLVQSAEETRYYLCGVYVQPHPEKGALLVATDGHRMLAHDAEGVCKKAAICAIDGEAFTRKVATPEVADKIEIDTDGIAAVGTYRSVKSVFIDGTYPDWSRVLLPVLKLAKNRFYGKPVLGAAAYNAKYISHLEKVVRVLNPEGGYRSVKPITFNDSDPGLVLFPDNPNIFGVLMPMRAMAMEPAFPAFMKEVLEPSRKTKKRAA
jgi:hypothetical protein